MSKIISLLVSQWCPLWADLNITDLFQGEHPEIFGWNRSRVQKNGFRRTKALISLITLRLILRTNRKSYMPSRLVPKSTLTILDDLEGSLCTQFQIMSNMVLLFIFSFTFTLLLVDK